MNKGELMKYAFNGDTTGIDTAIPKEYWECFNTYWWVTNCRHGLIDLVNLVDKIMDSGMEIPLEIAYWGLKKGDAIIVIHNNSMCITQYNKYVVLEENPYYLTVRPYGKKGGRNLQYTKWNTHHLVLREEDGHKIFTDMEASNIFRGDTLINLVSDLDRDALKKVIVNRALCPLSIDFLARIIHYTHEEANSDDQHSDMVVFPQLHTHCAPLDHIKSLPGRSSQRASASSI